MFRLLKLTSKLIPIIYLLFFLSQSAYSLPYRSQEIFRGERLALDVGTRLETSAPSERYKSMSFMGIDFYSFLHFGGHHRGELVAQVYLFDFRSLSFLDEPSQSSFDYAPCVIAPNLIIVPQGKLNLKFGHIWHSYGLRNEINTTQTTRQLINVENTGLLLDWGVELNGEQNGISYNLSLGTGSGKWPSFNGDRYMGVTRLSFNGDELNSFIPVEVGLSGLHAKIDTPLGLTHRWRAGLDLQYHGPLSILFEGSLGSDRSATNDQASELKAVNLFTEINWHSPSERWLVYLQYKSLSMETDSQASMTNNQAMLDMDMDMDAMMMSNSSNTNKQDSLILGTRYSPIRSLYIASESVLRHGDKHPLMRIQVRYRW